MKYLLLIAFAFLLAAGQVLFKKAALEGVGQEFPWSFINLWMIFALILYGGATLLWVWILQTTPLSIAYPFVALGFVIVPIAARYVFSEAIDLRYVIGAAMIIGGIILTSTKASL